MIVSELVGLLRTQDPDKVIGIQWGDDQEIVAYVEDLLLLTHLEGLTKRIGFGDRGIIYFMTNEDGESSLPIGDLLESLGHCEPTAQVAITIGDEEVGLVMTGTDLDEDAFLLTVERKEVIQSRS